MMSTSQAAVLNESFEEQKLLESFLRGTKLMKIIEDKTDQFISNYASSKKPEDARAAIILNLPLLYRDFVEKSQTLLHLLVEEPILFLDTAKYLIYSLITKILKGSVNSDLKTIDSEQLHVRFRFIGLPVQEELLYDITPNKYPGGLAVLTCVLSAYTEPENYTIQSIWYCTTGCQTNLIKKEVTREPNCYKCARPMSEYSKLRCTGRYRLLKVFSIRSVSTPRVFNKIFRSQVVHLKDPISPRMCSSITIGNQSNEDPYQIGPSTSRRSPMEFLTLSYSQTSLEDERATANTRADLHSSQNVQQDLTLVPSSVQRLYDTIKMAYSDFAFVYSLSAQMCQDRVPMDCFVHLKIGLLLSIASLEDNPDRPPISIVAIGPEFGMANYLMESIGNVAERFVGPQDDYKVTINKKSAHTWIEADPIVMARGGIYYVGDFGRLSAPRSFKMFKIIECGRVALEKTTITVPLEAAIWTHWRSYKYDTKDHHTFNKFLEIFGIPLMIEDENHEVLVDLMLEQASIKSFESTIDELSISVDDMRDFLSIISKRRVDLSDEASEILRKYFVASRIDRPDCLTQKSFSTLKLFAESFAKLSLRHDVIMIDAVAAIYMTENFIQNVFGPGSYPPPKFKAHTYIGAVDEHIVQFQEWVKNYISKFLEND